MNFEAETPSFDQVLQALTKPTKKHDPRALHLAAVTSAIVEVIVPSDEVTAPKVYAKVVTTLEGTLTSERTAESLPTQTALLELLSTIVPYVEPRTILVATLPLTSRVLRAIVSFIQGISDEVVMETKDELGGANAALRWTCRASSQMLKYLGACSDEKAVKQLLLGTLVTLFSDRRPKVRKAAHEAVLELLCAKGMGLECHQVIIKTITAYVRNNLAKAKKSRDVENFNKLLHLFPFLERSVLYLNYTKLGADIMELLIVLMQVEDASSVSDFVVNTKVQEVAPKVMTIGGLLSIVATLLGNESEERKRFLNEFAPRVLASLLQAKVSLIFWQGAAEYEVLEKARIHFGQVIMAASRRVTDSNLELSCKLFPLTVQMVVSLSRPQDEAPNDTTVADTLLVELTQMFRTNLPTIIGAGLASLPNCLEEVLRHAEQVMLPVFKATWSVSLKCLAVLLQYIHECIPIHGSVEKIIDLGKLVPLGSPSKQVTEDALSTFVQGVGIEKCWSWIRFHSNDKKHVISLDRAWILPVLKAAAHSAQPVPPRLAFFQTEVLGLAKVCDKLAATSSGHTSQYYHARVIDLWSLFPSFCRSPSDIQPTLTQLAVTLSRALEDRRYPELTSIICNGLVVLANGEKDLSTRSELDRKTLEASATKLLPTLFKHVTEANKPPRASENQMDVDGDEEANKGGLDMRAVTDAVSANKGGLDMRAVTDAVSALASIAPMQFLHGLFQKLMHRLVEEIQSENADKGKICSFLILAESLVVSAALDESHISFLYRALKPLVRTDEYGARVQKRAYKVLAEICGHYRPFVTAFERLKELTSLLSGAIMTSQVSARYMRLRCLNLIVDGLDETNKEHLAEFSKVMGEVLLCLKDANGKCRDAAYQFLLTMAARDEMKNFLQKLTAALGAETPHMRSAAVMALSRIVFEYAWNDPSFQTLLPSLLSTVLVLIDEDSREVIKSVIGFIRISVSAIPPDHLSPLLPELVGGLLTYHKKKDRFRSKIKIIIKKLVKLYGYETLLPLVPESETRLLTHMRKLDERKKRKKAAAREARIEEFDELLDSDEEDSDDGRTLLSGATGFTRLTGRTGVEKPLAERASKSRATAAKSRASIAAKSCSASSQKIRLPDETDGDVIDMLGPKISKRVHFEDINDVDSDSESVVMEFDDDGKLVVHEEDEVPMYPDAASPNKKRRLNNLEAPKNTRQASYKKNAPSKNALGAAYKSKKAGGDVKKKGQKYEPYAFMPLDGRAYTKKNRRAAVDQMSSVVRSGKRKRK